MPETEKHTQPFTIEETEVDESHHGVQQLDGGWGVSQCRKGQLMATL